MGQRRSQQFQSGIGLEIERWGLGTALFGHASFIIPLIKTGIWEYCLPKMFEI